MQHDPGATGAPAPDPDSRSTSHDDEDRPGRPDRINVGGGDDSVVRLQLAARWAEEFAPRRGDTLGGRLKRFRALYDYLDAVMHGVEPAEVEADIAATAPKPEPEAAAAAQPNPPAAPPAPQAPPATLEPPAWGAGSPTV